MSARTTDDLRERAYARYKMGERDLKSQPYIRRLIRRHFPIDRQARILDLGCGKGALLAQLRTEGYGHLVGVDVSRSQVEVCHERQLNVIEGECIEVLRSSENSSFDVVVSFDIIEHMHEAEIIALADQIHRVLDKSGRWIIHVPNADGPFGSRIRYADFTHEMAFTRESLTQMLKLCSFDRVNCYEDTPAIHGIPSLCRRVLWQVVRSLLLAYVTIETGSAAGRIFSQNLLAVATK